MVRLRGIATNALALSALACSNASGPAAPLLSGAWSGQNQGNRITMTLVESSSNITGSGNVSDANRNVPLTVSGTHNHPGVALTLQPEGYAPFTFDGTFILTSRDSIGGKLNGSGFIDFAFIFVRQP